MTTTCRICEQPIETPETSEGPPPVEHTRCREEPPREQESAYQSDLRSLIALACAGVKAPPREETDALDAPLSVREAIRLTEALLPAPPAAPRRRLRRTALPLLALAGAGAVVQGWQLVGHPPALPAVTVTPTPALVEVLASPLAAARVTEPEPEPLLDPEASDRPPTPEPTVQPLAARPQPAVASRPRTAAVRASTTTPAPPVTAAPEPPSLMQAITDAVRSGPSSKDRR